MTEKRVKPVTWNRPNSTIITVTGAPGIGKTTLCKKVIEILQNTKPEVSVGGFITNEIREKGKRTGFVMVDLITDNKEILAHISLKSSVKVGKYGVNLDGIRNLGVKAIVSGILFSDIVIVDEVGPMELRSREFEKSIYQLIDSDKSALLTIHRKSNHPLLKYLRQVYPPVEITFDNRGYVTNSDS
jgi:nucleoside-triphosphatase